MPIPQHVVNLIEKKDPMVVELSLADQDLDDDDVKQLVDLLELNTHIRSLDLSRNNISLEGAKSLATITGLKKLNISHNYIDEDGLKALTKCYTLKWLNVANNGIPQEVAGTIYKSYYSHFDYLNTGFNFNERGEVIPLSALEIECNKTNYYIDPTASYIRFDRRSTTSRFFEQLQHIAEKGKDASIDKLSNELMNQFGDSLNHLSQASKLAFLLNIMNKMGIGLEDINSLLESNNTNLSK